MASDLAFLDDGNVKMVGFAEPNVDWTCPGMRRKTSNWIKRAWRHSGLVTSSSGIPSSRGYQVGGTAMIVNGRWTARATCKYVDPIGRWTAITITGKDRKGGKCGVD